ncbi:MAG: hypothetical protein HY298_10935 [Verrucomicrobia bacterium]|nr:hypothetical protein [Verrucomicrobiota bacterium]
MNPPNTTVNTYSPFWALCVLFVTLLFLQTTYLIDDFKQKSQIQAARAQFKPTLTQAQNISQTTEAVGRELVALAPNSPEAAKIISEFKIQLNKPAQPAK